MRDAALVDDFDARRSEVGGRTGTRSSTARWPTRSSPIPWWIPEPLDLSLLRLGADPFLGEHDFATFCRKGPPNGTTTRRVFEASWLDLGDGVLRFDITASAFCQRMVRSIVGTLADVGIGKIRPGEILGLLRAADRNLKQRVAAAQGLCLWEVGY